MSSPRSRLAPSNSRMALTCWFALTVAMAQGQSLGGLTLPPAINTATFPPAFRSGDLTLPPAFATPADLLGACGSQLTAFSDCVFAASDAGSATGDDDFFVNGVTLDEDDPVETCEDAQRVVTGQCGKGPSVCQVSYEAYVVCVYQDQVKTRSDQDCDLSCGWGCESCDADDMWDVKCGAFSKESNKFGTWYAYPGLSGVCHKDTCCASDKEECCEPDAGKIAGLVCGIIAFFCIVGVAIFIMKKKPLPQDDGPPPLKEMPKV